MKFAFTETHDDEKIALRCIKWWTVDTAGFWVVHLVKLECIASEMSRY